jgi:hypothetical protein
MENHQVHYRLFGENDINELIFHMCYLIKECFRKIDVPEVIGFIIS